MASAWARVGRPSASATAAAILDPAARATESFELSKTKVYRMSIGPGNGPFKVDGAYVSNKQTVVRERAALGAARPAAALNANVK